MSSLVNRLENCCSAKGVDLQLLLEKVDVNFDNLSMSNIRFIEDKCWEARDKILNSDKVDAYRTVGLAHIGFSDVVYFSADEYEEIKKLSHSKVDRGEFNFTVEKVRITEGSLNGLIRDRDEWKS